MVNDEVARSAFQLLGDDFVQLFGRFGQLHVDAEEAAALDEDAQALVGFDAEIQVGQRFQRAVDVDQLVVAKGALLRGKRGKVTYEGPAKGGGGGGGEGGGRGVNDKRWGER